MASISRRKRKRIRRRTAEATARKPGHLGGCGGSAQMRRLDFQLVRKAIREGWAIPLRTKNAILAEASRAMDDHDRHVRLALAAIGFVVDAEGANQQAEFALRRIGREAVLAWIDSRKTSQTMVGRAATSTTDAIEAAAKRFWDTDRPMK
jgi:hypothetical protein